MASNSKLSNAVYDFVHTVPEKLKCSICTDLLSDPRLTECCGQHYCQKCLQSWLKQQRKQSCPHCRQRNFVHILDKSVTRDINQLKVRCSHHEEGCEWVGELGDLQTHLNSKQGCKYEKVDCPNGCRSKLEKGSSCSKELRFIRKDLYNHLREECDQRWYKCTYCGKEDTYRNIIHYHYLTSCPNFPLDCPHKCGATGIKRKDLPTHRGQCPLEPMPCPFKEAGCETRPVRKDLEEHLTSQGQQHLLMTFRKTCSQEQECTQLKKKNTEFERRCHTLEENNGGLEGRCTKLEDKNTELERSCRMLETRNGDLEERCTKLEQVNIEHEIKLTSKGSQRRWWSRDPQ